MSQNESVNNSNEPKEPRKPQPGEGIRSMRSSYAFRMINYELYAKPSNYLKKKIIKIFLIIYIFKILWLWALA